MIQIRDYISAGYPCLLIRSSEDERMCKLLIELYKQISEKAKEDYGFARLTAAGEMGLLYGASTTMSTVGSLAELLSWMIEGGRKNLLLFAPDLAMQLGPDIQPGEVRLAKELFDYCKSNGICLVLCSSYATLHPELHRLVMTIELPLPSKQEIEEQARTMRPELCADAGQIERVVDAASGLTHFEVENALALSLVRTGAFTAEVIASVKKQVYRGSGLVEILEPVESVDDIGGLDLLKRYLVQRQYAFTKEAASFGLPSPKGLLLVGIPGCGKSLTAKVAGRILQRPTLRLDVGRIYGGIVGQSESQMRDIIQIAEACSPCVLMIEELEKAFSQTNGMSDGGTSQRVFGHLLTWLQDKTAPVFVVATANNVSALPPELLRPGRFDASFWLDLPNEQEREAIWRLHLAKYPSAILPLCDEEIMGLATLSVDWTGAEIEQVIKETLFDVFDADRGTRLVGAADIATHAATLVPQSTTMAENITAMRQWAKGRMRPATTPPPKTKKTRSVFEY